MLVEKVTELQAMCTSDVYSRGCIALLQQARVNLEKQIYNLKQNFSSVTDITVSFENFLTSHDFVQLHSESSNSSFPSACVQSLYNMQPTLPPTTSVQPSIASSSIQFCSPSVSSAQSSVSNLSMRTLPYSVEPSIASTSVQSATLVDLYRSDSHIMEEQIQIRKQRL